MANKRLTNEEISTMRQMVLDGVSPEDMSKHFSIAISSVHNYKKRFKQEGMEFPMIRGQRPSGDVHKPQRDLVEELDHVEQKVKKMIHKSVSIPVIEQQSECEYKFYVKGKLIEIKGDITNIILRKDTIEIVV
jgi:transposase